MHCVPLAVFVVLGLLLVVGAQNPPVKKAPSGGMSCYQCNSQTKGQEKCDSSEEADLAKFKKACPKITDGELAGTEAKACRKVLQTVTGESGVVRECAYTGEAEVDGKRRIGNKGIVLYLYQCTNAEKGKPCNSASSPSMLSVLVVTGLSALYRMLH